MTPSEYVRLAVRTESTKNANMTERLEHSAIGCCTETGELMDLIKRQLFYNKALDKKEAAKELGDILWYVAIGCDALGFTMEEIMEANIAKLRARYPDKYTDEQAIQRDTKQEDKAADPLLDVNAHVNCTLPPKGWKCTRFSGHTGPCAAVAD